MKTVRRRSTTTLSLGLLAAAAVACSGKDLPPPGELMVVITTDASPPKDIDTLHVEVLSDGKTQFGYDYALGPGGLLVPATLGLVAGRNAATPALIRVYARKGGASGLVRVLREATVTVPTDRVAMLPMPINWLCYDDANEPTPGHVVNAKCGEGQTCAAGRCVDATVADSNALPDFAPASVFGGGTGHGDGVCFDTLACFASVAPAAVDLATCTIAKPAPAGINVAMQVGTGAGACEPGGAPCFIALDGESDEGWQTSATDPTLIQLPVEVCARIVAGKVTGVFTSTSCATKQPSTPPCGPGSSVGSAASDAGAE